VPSRAPLGCAVAGSGKRQGGRKNMQGFAVPDGVVIAFHDDATTMSREVGLPGQIRVDAVIARGFGCCDEGSRTMDIRRSECPHGNDSRPSGHLGWGLPIAPPNHARRRCSECRRRVFKLRSRARHSVLANPRRNCHFPPGRWLYRARRLSVNTRGRSVCTGQLSTMDRL
jgi:hypothetical protein